MKAALLDAQLASTEWKLPSPLRKLGRLDWEKPNLIEEAQQPGLAVAKGRLRLREIVPDLDGAAEELIAAGALESVDAEVRAPDSHDVRRRPGPRGVVFGRDEAMARIERHGNGRAEIDIAES